MWRLPADLIQPAAASGEDPMRLRGRWVTPALGGVVTVALALILVPSAFSQGSDEYTASITPSSVTASTPGTHAFTITIANSGGSGDLGSANVDVAAGFTGATIVSPTLTGSGNENWTAVLVSGTIQL